MPFNYKTELHRYRRYYQSINEVAAKPQTRAYTTAIFSFLAVSLFGWYAIRPTIQTILTLQKEIEDNRLVSAQMEEKIGKLIEAHATYQSVENDVPYVSQALPPAPEVLTALGQIRNIAHLRGASISAITSSAAPLLSKEQTAPKTPAAAPKGIFNRKVKSVQLSVVLVGTFESLAAIIEDIVSMRRIVTIESMGFTPDREMEQLKLVMRMNAHYIDSE
ncbi:type 4a pilus biogenesis protein PilO [Candidatus Gottesmanbacteria bacterium]|nr:type 4a pilus biogenesis protein PilO [Candidatus Gottesmanbacteria bacterium]